MIPFAVLPFHVGPVAALIGDIDISFLVGLIVASACYYFWPSRSSVLIQHDRR